MVRRGSNRSIEDDQELGRRTDLSQGAVLGEIANSFPLLRTVHRNHVAEVLILLHEFQVEVSETGVLSEPPLYVEDTQ